MAACQQTHVTRNAEVKSEGNLSFLSFSFVLILRYLFYFTMIHNVVVLYLNLLIVHVAVPFDYNKPKWPIPYRYENAEIFCVGSSYEVMWQLENKAFV